MRIPQGFREVCNVGTSIITDREKNEYLLVPAKNGFPEFWISAHEISKNMNRKTEWYHPGCSRHEQKPWLFVNLDEARQVAEKHGGRIPTESEYQRFFELFKKLHLGEEKYFVWTETKEHEGHFVTRKGEERRICYPSRATNFITFRIILK